MCKVIGIDISKASFDVAFKKNDDGFVFYKFDNQQSGFKQFSKLLSPGDHCVMEASGPYYLFLAQYLFEQSVNVSVVNPLQVKHFVRMRMTRAKTDKKDAQMIALYGQSEHPDLWKPDQEYIRQMQQINTALEGLHKQAVMLSNQLEAFNCIPFVDKELVKTLKSLEKTILAKINKLENRMVLLAEKHYGDTMKALKSIPGIGSKTAILLITVTDNFKKFETSKKLSAFVGLAPRVYQSGTSVKGKGHITKMGNHHLRKLLYLCSWSAKKHNSQCKEMYQRLKQKGKPEKVIKVAIANKLLRQAFTIATRLTEYEKNYHFKFAF